MVILFLLWRGMREKDKFNFLSAIFGLQGFKHLILYKRERLFNLFKTVVRVNVNQNII